MTDGNKRMLGYLLRLVVFAGIAVAGFFGAWLLGGYSGDDREQASCRAALARIEYDFGELAGCLRRYEKDHGRYPTNDEGLAALDTFAARFRIPAFRFAHTDLQEAPRVWLSLAYRAYHHLGAEIDKFKGAHDRVPNSAEELLGMGPGSRVKVGPDQEGMDVPAQELGITPAGRVFGIVPGGIESIWGVYHYENRAGHDPADFADSPVMAGTDRPFARELAPGVYLHSFAGQIAAEELDQLWWADAWKRIAGGALLLLAGVIAVASIRRWGRANAVLAVLALLAPAAAGEKLSRCYMTCYTLQSYAYPTYEQVPGQRKALLAKYRDRGVITQATYDRAVGPQDVGPATRPGQATTQPNP